MLGRITDKHRNDLGSGFTVGARVALTAAHVISARGARSILFVTPDDKSVRVARIELAEDWDLAVLHLGTKVADPLTLGKAVDNEHWRVEDNPSLSCGAVTGSITSSRREIISNEKHRITVVQLLVEQILGTYAGYSGSPVVRESSRGTAVGMLIEEKKMRLSARQNEASNVLFALALDGVIERFGLGAGVAPAADEGTVATDPATAALASFEGLMYSSIDLQRWYLRSVPDTQRAPDANDLASVIDALNQMAPTHIGVPPLAEFVARAHRQLVAPSLDQWLRSILDGPLLVDVRQRLDFEEKEDADPAQRFLLVEVHTNDDPLKPSPPDPAKLEFWLHTSKGWVDHGEVSCSLYDEAGSPTTAEERIRDSFQTILEHALPRVGRDMVMEFLLPRKLFGLRPHHWEFGTDYEAPEPIGVQHPVVLRWRDRLRNAGLARAEYWRERAEDINKRLHRGQAPTILCVNRDEYTPLDLKRALSDPHKALNADVVGLLFVPPEIPPDAKHNW